MFGFALFGWTTRLIGFHNRQVLLVHEEELVQMIEVVDIYCSFPASQQLMGEKCVPKYLRDRV